MNAGNRSSPGLVTMSLSLAGVLACLDQKFGCAEHRLRGQNLSDIAWEPDLHAPVSHRFNHEQDEGRTTSAESRDRVELRLAEDHDTANRLEHRPSHDNVVRRSAPTRRESRSSCLDGAVFGIARMTREAAGAMRASMCESGTPAAIETMICSERTRIPSSSSTESMT